MANGSAPGEGTKTIVRMSAFERLPWRRMILVALSVGITVFVVWGSWKTLQSNAYSAEAWKQFVILGIAQGAILALIALGYTLVYGILRMINFAHGEVFMAGAFGSYFFAAAYTESGFMNRHPIEALGILFLTAIITSVVDRGPARADRVSAAPELAAPGAVDHRDRRVAVPAEHGAGTLRDADARLPEARDPHGDRGRSSGPRSRGSRWWSSWYRSWRWSILQIFVSRTKTGKSMRAVAEDQEIASLMGIDVDRIVVTTFVIGGILAGIAGVLFALTFEQVNFFMGVRPGIAAFTAAVLGGIGSIGGAALGGFLLGLLQSVGPALLLTGIGVPSPFQLKDVVTFAVLVLVLIFRPGGLLGSGGSEKV